MAKGKKETPPKITTGPGTMPEQGKPMTLEQARMMVRNNTKLIISDGQDRILGMIDECFAQLANASKQVIALKDEQTRLVQLCKENNIDPSATPGQAKTKIQK